MVSLVLLLMYFFPLLTQLPLTSPRLAQPGCALGGQGLLYATRAVAIWRWVPLDFVHVRLLFFLSSSCDSSLRLPGCGLEGGRNTSLGRQGSWCVALHRPSLPMKPFVLSSNLASIFSENVTGLFPVVQPTSSLQEKQPFSCSSPNTAPSLQTAIFLL